MRQILQHLGGNPRTVDREGSVLASEGGSSVSLFVLHDPHQSGQPGSSGERFFKVQSLEDIKDLI